MHYSALMAALDQKKYCIAIILNVYLSPTTLMKNRWFFQLLQLCKSLLSCVVKFAKFSLQLSNHIKVSDWKNTIGITVKKSVLSMLFLVAGNS